MLCEKFATCAFFKTYKNDISTRQYEFLIATYCEGDLQPQCKRMKWRQCQNEDPPETRLNIQNAYKNGHPLSGGHNFVFLDISINNKPFFVSEVVIYRTNFHLKLNTLPELLPEMITQDCPDIVWNMTSRLLLVIKPNKNGMTFSSHLITLPNLLKD